MLLIRPDSNERDAHALACEGLSVWIDPYLQTAPAADPKGARELLQAVQELGAADSPRAWLIVTSPRAYPAWSALVGRDRLDAAIEAAAASGLRAGAVGPATALTLPDPGWPPPLVPAVATVTGLVAALSHVRAGLAIAPQSAIARPELTDSLTQLGWAVVARAVYDTIIVGQRPRSADAVRAGQVAAVVLRSPSAVEALLHHATPAPGVRLVAAGPATARALTLHGLDCIRTSGPSPAEVAAACALAVGR